MAATVLTPNTAVGPFPTLQPAADSLDITMTAADASNGNRFLGTGRELVIVRNSGAGARTFTLTSVASATSKRTGDITTYSLAAGDVAVFWVGSLEGWRNTDGYVYLSGSHAEILFGVVRIP